MAVKDQRSAGVFTPEEKERITQAIQKKYVQVASSAQGKFKYDTGKKGAEALGYEAEILEEIPEKLLESFSVSAIPFPSGKSAQVKMSSTLAVARVLILSSPAGGSERPPGSAVLT